MMKPPPYAWQVVLLTIMSLGLVHTVLPYGVITAIIFTGTSVLTACALGLALWLRAGLKPYMSWVFVFVAVLLSVPGHAV